MNKTVKRSLWKADKLWIGNRHKMWEIYLIKGCFSTQNHIYIMFSISCLLWFYGYDPHVVSTSLSFPHSWLIDGFVLRVQWRVPLVEQELLTLLEHLNSPLPVFSGVRVAQLFVFYVMFCRSLFVLLFFFLLAIVLFGLLRFTDYDYHFGIFKLFLQK